MANLPTNPSESTKRLNPNLYPSMGASETQVTKPTSPQALDGEHAKLKGCAPSVWRICSGPRPRKVKHTTQVTVTFVAYRRRLLDDDNNSGAMKPLRDAVAKWIHMDDGDPRWRWEYAQVLTRAQEGVSVKLEY